MPTTAVQMRLTKQDGRARMELRLIFDSSEHMEQLERWGAFEVFPQSVGQMVGDGLARLFPPDEPRIPFELRSAQTFKTGVLNLSYALAKD
jgi:hypothetical protein